MKRRKEIILALMLLSLFTPHLAEAQRTWNTGNDLSMCLKSVEEIRLYLASPLIFNLGGILLVHGARLEHAHILQVRKDRLSTIMTSYKSDTVTVFYPFGNSERVEAKATIFLLEREFMQQAISNKH